MNKKKLDMYLGRALKALQDEEDCQIVKDGKCDKAFRQQTSAFGAAVEMGSLKAAALFYSQKGDAKVDRSLLLRAMYYIIHQRWEKDTVAAALKEINSDSTMGLQNEYLTAAVALKLALNAFVIPEN